jgi:DNA-binding LacI/PurR family transcriptional regulator
VASRRIPLVSCTTRALATVRMSAADVGATGFRALFRLIGGERHEGEVYQIPTALVIRESTARATR